jgi:hypothetical protein
MTLTTVLACSGSERATTSLDSGSDAVAATDAGNGRPDAASEGGTTTDAGPVNDAALEGAVDAGLPAPEALAMGRNTPQGIAVYDTDVYWTEKDPAMGEVMKITIGGGQPQTLAPGDYAPAWLAVDGTGVYWAAFGDNDLDRVSTQGGTATTLYTGLGVWGGAVDPTNVYTVSGYGDTPIVEVPKDGGAATKIAFEQGVAASVAVNTERILGHISLMSAARRFERSVRLDAWCRREGTAGRRYGRDTGESSSISLGGDSGRDERLLDK